MTSINSVLFFKLGNDGVFKAVLCISIVRYFSWRYSLFLQKCVLAEYCNCYNVFFIHYFQDLRY